MSTKTRWDVRSVRHGDWRGLSWQDKVCRVAGYWRLVNGQWKPALPISVPADLRPAFKTDLHEPWLHF